MWPAGAWLTTVGYWAQYCRDAVSFALQGDPNDYDSDSDAAALDVSVASDA